MTPSKAFANIPDVLCSAVEEGTYLFERSFGESNASDLSGCQFGNGILFSLHYGMSHISLLGNHIGDVAGRVRQEQVGWSDARWVVASVASVFIGLERSADTRLKNKTVRQLGSIVDTKLSVSCASAFRPAPWNLVSSPNPTLTEFWTHNRSVLVNFGPKACRQTEITGNVQHGESSYLARQRGGKEIARPRGEA